MPHLSTATFRLRPELTPKFHPDEPSFSIVEFLEGVVALDTNASLFTHRQTRSAVRLILGQSYGEISQKLSCGEAAVRDDIRVVRKHVNLARYNPSFFTLLLRAQILKIYTRGNPDKLPLTEHERRLVRGLVAGASIAEIGSAKYLSERQVRYEIDDTIGHKCGLLDRGLTAVGALVTGRVTMDELHENVEGYRQFLRMQRSSPSL